jgi:hypothetical protein
VIADIVRPERTGEIAVSSRRRRRVLRSSWRILLRTVVPTIVLVVAAQGAVASAAGLRAPQPGSAQRPSPTSFDLSTTKTTPFGWLAATTPPTSWRRLTLPPGLATLSLPPGFRPLRGDPGTASAALLGPRGTYLGYLNATPRQGNEGLRDWTRFRLAHLRQDDAASVREDAQVSALAIGRTRRSCVTDDYTTTVGRHPFHEVACLVMAGHLASVIVAATPAGDPAHLWRQLERAVAAYPFPTPSHPLARAADTPVAHR